MLTTPDGVYYGIDPATGYAYRLDPEGWPVDAADQPWPDADADGRPDVPAGYAPLPPELDAETVHEFVDADGNPIAVPYGFDDDGWPLDRDGERYGWDDQGRPIDDDGNRVLDQFSGDEGWYIADEDGNPVDFGPLGLDLYGRPVWGTGPGEPYPTVGGWPVFEEADGDLYAVNFGSAIPLDENGWPLTPDGERWPADADGQPVPPGTVGTVDVEPVDPATLARLVDADGTRSTRPPGANCRRGPTS